MLEFNSFCYLENHKTGCTFVVEFLRRFCNEPVVSYDKHAAVEKPVPGKLYFTNVREPLALYRSLYAYGLDGRGKVFLHLKRQGRFDLYAKGADGFVGWLEFVLDERHSTLLSKAYTPRVARAMGFMSWRFLRLACAGFEAAVPTMPNAAALQAYMRDHYLLTGILHQESLREDLRKLIRGRLAGCINNPDAALAWLGEAPDINRSVSVESSSLPSLPADLHARLLAKEAYLYRRFYRSQLVPAA
jgi:hypothetical protein